MDDIFNEVKGTEADVCRDITQRQQLGLRKYGVQVRDNPLSLKAWLQHAYEETLDKAVYLKRAIEEIEKNEDNEEIVACQQKSESKSTSSSLS